MRRTARIFGSRSAIASTWLGDRRRPVGGVFDGATGIGASELVDWPEEDAVVVVARAELAPANARALTVNAAARADLRDITRA